ncbi:MAG: thiosulfate sulfurtransferase GlpE [Bacterioplanes sp.]|nr:thiosulfate sulfurtransferase GlpE [Bacterioplanes sp.]
MSTFEHITIAGVKELQQQEPVTIVDIRDPRSFQESHIQHAQRLDNDNIQAFLAAQDPQQAVVVCCYHGNSSQGAAQFLAAQGLTKVYSLDGGFERWRLACPELCEQG